LSLAIVFQSPRLRLVERWGVFLRREVDRLPPISAHGPKGEPLFAVADLDAWASALPRRGPAANARTQPRGEDVTDGEASQKPRAVPTFTATRIFQPPSSRT
jgi:hypothetical protein